MSLFLKKNVPLLLALLTIAPSVFAAPSPVTPKHINPHGEGGDCSLCHLLSAKELSRLTAADAAKRRLRADFVAVCLQCHGVGFGHGVGKKPDMNRESLPLDKDGKITCAVTCHNMHLKDPLSPHQDRYHLRLPSERLCVSCHDK